MNRDVRVETGVLWEETTISKHLENAIWKPSIVKASSIHPYTLIKGV